MTRYSSQPDHPLKDVPAEVLRAARDVLWAAAEWGDVDPEMMDPVADSVVMALLPWLSWDPECPDHEDCDGNPLTCMVREGEAAGLYEAEERRFRESEPEVGSGPDRRHCTSQNRP